MDEAWWVDVDELIAAIGADEHARLLRDPHGRAVRINGHAHRVLGLRAGRWRVVKADSDAWERVYTPRPVADAVMEWLHMRWHMPHIVDPCVGGGALRDAAHRLWIETTAIDIDPYVDADWHGDFCGWPGLETMDSDTSIVANPPFSAAQPMIRAALENSVSGEVAMIMPSGLCGRALSTGWPALFADHPCMEVPLDGRPWHTSREISVYVWDHLAPGRGVLTLTERVRWR